MSSAGTITVSYEYDEADLLSKITHDGFDHYFGYDGSGNTVNIKVGIKNLTIHIYETGNGNLLYSLHGNNYKISYGHDLYNRVTSIQKNNASTYRYDYDARGSLARVTDTSEATPKITSFLYDMVDRLVRETFGVDTEIRQRYGDMSCIISQYSRFRNQTRLISFTYTVDNRKKEINPLSGGKMTFSYDALDRIFITDVNHVASTDSTFRTQVEFADLPAGNRTTILTKNHFSYKRVGNTNIATLSSCAYTHDNSGNISTVTDAARNLIIYIYDQLNQLVRVDDQKAGNTITHNYDVGGSITQVRHYPYSTGQPGNALLSVSYPYDDDDWKDALTSYDGQSTTYDQTGNPLTHHDDMSSTWTGRQLAIATVNGEVTSYTYNSGGIRTSKTVDGIITDYLVDGSTILAQNAIYDTLWFMYNSDGTRVGPTYHNDAYYYLKSARGDVTGIIDSNLNVVVEYSYDARGKLTGTTGNKASFIGKLNSLLYRGYCYDVETGLYYLNSRYYDPVTGRYLNVDIILGLNKDVLACNLFTYCSNNLTNFHDPMGLGKVWDWISNTVKSVANSVKGFVSNYLTDSNNVCGLVADGLSIGGAGGSLAFANLVNSAPRPKNIGADTWRKTASQDLRKIRKLENTLSKILGKVSYGAVALDTGIGIYDNIQNHASQKKILIDATTDIAVSGGNIWAAGAAGSALGAAAGTVVPAFGNIVGAAAGFVIGTTIYVFTDGISIQGNTIRGHVKDFANSW